ncbi:hypothetical protein SK128_024739 [Halocaridina rubra]|uniref:RING-type E3 ubiquitin transferase n=1 Tax=Halocaridina rubra TaxID=373956 RepID=A0AAN9A4Q7_HALRR
MANSSSAQKDLKEDNEDHDETGSYRSSHLSRSSSQGNGNYSVSENGGSTHSSTPIRQEMVPSSFDGKRRSLTVQNVEGCDSILPRTPLPSPVPMQSTSNKNGAFADEKWKSSLCVQCSEVYDTDNRTPSKLSCGHTICGTCLLVLLERAPRCPVCQTKIGYDTLKPRALLSCKDQRINRDTRNNEDTLKTNIKLPTEVNFIDKPGTANSFIYNRGKIWVCVQCSETYETAKQVPRALDCLHELCDTCLLAFDKKTLRCRICSPNEKDNRFAKYTGKASPVVANESNSVDDNENTSQILSNSGITTKSAMKSKVFSRIEASVKNINVPKLHQTPKRHSWMCGICSSMYKTADVSPKILSCEHKLCKNCLQYSRDGLPTCQICATDCKDSSRTGDSKSIYNDLSVRRKVFDESKEYVEEDLQRLKNYVTNSKKPLVTNGELLKTHTESNPSEESSRQQKRRGTSPLMSTAEMPVKSQHLQRIFATDRECSESSIDADNIFEENSRSALKCPDCCLTFDDIGRQPRVLQCGHTVCTACLHCMISRSSDCPVCFQPLVNLKNVHDAAYNMALYELIMNIDLKPNVENEKKTRDISPTNSRAEKPLVDAESSVVIPELSPHSSRCLEMGIVPISYCASCLKWVCSECGLIDHPQNKECFLISKGEALHQMKDAHVNGVRVTSEAVNDSLRTLQNYQDHLDALSLSMQAAFESIGKEKERIRCLMEEGHGKIWEMKTSVSRFSKGKNLRSALSLMENVEEVTKNAQQWTTSAMKMVDSREIIIITKENLFTSLQLMQLSNVKKRVGSLFASHTYMGKTLLSRILIEEGLLFVHSLESISTVPKGSRALPLSSIKMCLDALAPQVFLDIGWKGNIMGRIIIRLMGDTLRGNQFLLMCTGEAGPSFVNTHFHCIWMRDDPGEQIWGGDYDKGDGNGGASIIEKVPEMKDSSHTVSKCKPIKAGLVAGSCERTDMSTLFRIYTRDLEHPNGKESLLSGDSVEADDPAAFGIVEYGLDSLRSVTRLGSVTEVTIYSCGIVIEA